MVNIKQNQKGIAAILVSIILVLVVGLIIFSFSEVSRTNQNEALVNQLGQQAFDAANTAADIAASNVTTKAYNNQFPIAPTSSCDQTTYLNLVGSNLDGKLSIPNNVQVTCLLVNPLPTSLVLGADSVNNSVVWRLNPPAGSAIATLNLSWQGDPNAANNTCNETLNQYPIAKSYNCNVPILNVDVFQDNRAAYPGGTGTPQSLNQYTANFFIQPTKNNLVASDTAQATIPNSFPSITYGNPNSPNYASNPRVFMCPVTIDQTTQKEICNATIYLPTTPLLNLPYFVRIAPMYEEATNISLTPKGSGGSPIPLADSQAVIDVTAKAQTAVRRLQFRVKLPTPGGTSNQPFLPNNAIESAQSICKQLNVSNVTSESDNCLKDSL